MWVDNWDDDIQTVQKNVAAIPKESFGGHRETRFSMNRNRETRNYTNSNFNRSINTKPSFPKYKVIQIPSKFVGMIIGKKGATITNFQLISNTRIEVLKERNCDTSNSFESTSNVKIHYGNEDNLQTAENLILEKIDSFETDKKQWNSARSVPDTIRTQSDFLPRDEFSPLSNTAAEPIQNTDSNSTTFFEPPPGKTAAEMLEENERLFWSKFPTIRKDFYQELPEVSQMTKEQVESIRLEQNNIMVERISFKKFNPCSDPDEKHYIVDDDDNLPIPNPVTTFEQAFHNYPEILAEIRKAGFTTPSPIQCQAWPILLSGYDMIGIAQTGTGKTLAFLLPALIHIDGQNVKRPERQGPAVLIFAPTRELAMQIDKEVKKYTYRNIKSLCVYGGSDRKAQIEKINSGIDIVIATPGRLNDLHASKKLSLESITYVVLDEADRMLDMGFEPQIRKIMYCLQPSHQCIMTSATFPSDVIRLATTYTSKPIKVTVGSLDLTATHSVTQTIIIVNEDEKEKKFVDYVAKNFHETSPYNAANDKKIIVFCRTKGGADNLTVECALKDLACASLHGAKEQEDREQIVVDITTGNINVLIATDLASRGLDIPDVTHVFNYDFPKNIEEYVHRVGRTGRAGKSGESITYFTRGDWMHAEALIKILEEANQEVPNELHNMAKKYEIHQKTRQEAGYSGRGRGRGRGNSRGRGGHGGFLLG